MNAFRKTLFAAAAALAACSPSDKPEVAANEPKGLPMWVIEDKDSTIYMTGTVHMLPPDLVWTNSKLTKAIGKADELWLEIPMKSDPVEMARDTGPMMIQRMFSFNRPLSTLLTAEERVLLQQAAERAKLDAAAIAGLDNLKPWAVTMMLGLGPLMASGYDAEAGIDMSILRIAEKEKDTIRAFETFEFQMNILAGGTEEEQLAALRQVLRADPVAAEQVLEASDAAYEAWAMGDATRVEELVAAMRAGGPGMEGMDIEVMLDNRNRNWAEQIDKLLKEEDGVSFIAVGAAHLVGKNSVQDFLSQRGIEAKPY